MTSVQGKSLLLQYGAKVDSWGMYNIKGYRFNFVRMKKLKILRNNKLVEDISLKDYSLEELKQTLSDIVNFSL